MVYRATTCVADDLDRRSVSRLSVRDSTREPPAGFLRVGDGVAGLLVPKSRSCCSSDYCGADNFAKSTPVDPPSSAERKNKHDAPDMGTAQCRQPLPPRPGRGVWRRRFCLKDAASSTTETEWDLGFPLAADQVAGLG
jgi:hypothetical protein